MRQHRSSSASYHTSGGSTLFSSPKFWITGVLTILIIWWLYGLATSSTPTGNATGLIVSLNGSGSEVTITDTKGKSTSIEARTPLETNIQKIAVKKGEGLLSSTSFTLILNTNAEMQYDTTGSSGIVWTTGKGWLEAKDTTNLELRNITARVYTGSTVLISQSTISSSITVLVGSAMVKVKDSSTTLSAGNMLTILNGDMNSTSLSVIDKIQPIDEVTQQDSFFIKHKGNITISTDTESGTVLNNTSSGSTTLGSTSGTLLSTSEKYIEISTPTDESTVSSATIDIAGKILNPLVTRVTINDQEATVSPVEMTFTLSDFTITDSVTNIVYKAFDSQKNLLQKSVLTVYANTSAITQTTRPSVTTYPVSDENFKIIAPTENPYKTTEDVIQIQGSVPANLVKYITVNNFRLTKFIPYSTTWYYFANKEYDTMNEGINEYTIQYFDINDSLLSTGKFIIVKETQQVTTEEPLLQ